MIRKFALALCIAAGTAFVVQPAFAADKAPDKTADKTEKKDAENDALIKKAEDLAAKATKDGKKDLADAYTAEADAYTKLKEAKASGDAIALKTAKDEVDKAKKAVDDAKKKPAAAADTDKKKK